MIILWKLYASLWVGVGLGFVLFPYWLAFPAVSHAVMFFSIVTGLPLWMYRIMKWAVPFGDDVYYAHIFTADLSEERNP